MGERRLSSLDEVQPHHVYERHSIEELFGVGRWQVQKWCDTGVLKRLPQTGKRIKVAGVELLRFAREVLGVEQALRPPESKRCKRCSRPSSWCACSEREEGKAS